LLIAQNLCPHLNCTKPQHITQSNCDLSWGTTALIGRVRYKVIEVTSTGVLISPQPDQEGNKLQRQKILNSIYLIYNELWRIRRNYELEAIIKGENMVRFINAKEYDGLVI